jgi:hypothetical protein
MRTFHQATSCRNPAYYANRHKTRRFSVAGHHRVPEFNADVMQTKSRRPIKLAITESGSRKSPKLQRSCLNEPPRPAKLADTRAARSWVNFATTFAAE